jgi:hypothetical protein
MRDTEQWIHENADKILESFIEAEIESISRRV